MTADDLAALDLAALEDVFVTARCHPLPSGVWQGRYLRELPMSLPKRLVARAMFRWPTFGLDLDHREWWFHDPARRVARFEPRPGRSRWRETEVVQLDYQRTGPRVIRGMLYDELKPLGPDCILGLGGSNHDGARGTWFYFALAPVLRA